MEKLIVNFKQGLIQGMGFVLVVGIFVFGFYLVKGWNGLQATDGDQLTAQKWNELVDNQKAKFAFFNYGTVRTTTSTSFVNDSNAFLDLSMKQGEIFYFGADVTAYTSNNSNPCIYNLIKSSGDCEIITQSHPFYTRSTGWEDGSTRIIIKANSDTTCKIMGSYKINASGATCGLVNTSLYAYKIGME